LVARRSSDELTSVLTSLGFELLASEPGGAPLLIADHARKFQLLVSHKMVLRRTN
jgi:hypothetical protein